MKICVYLVTSLALALATAPSHAETDPVGMSRCGFAAVKAVKEKYGLQGGAVIHAYRPFESYWMRFPNSRAYDGIFIVQTKLTATGQCVVVEVQ